MMGLTVLMSRLNEIYSGPGLDPDRNITTFDIRCGVPRDAYPFIDINHVQTTTSVFELHQPQIGISHD